MTLRKNITPDFVIGNMDILRDMRTDKGLSRQKLASLTGVSMEMIAQYENCSCLPKKDNYNKLADFFGFRIWE